MKSITKTSHPDTVLHVWGTDPKAGELAFCVVYRGVATARAELPAEAREAVAEALRKHHPRHASYFLDGNKPKSS